ncbi:phosphotransferase [Microdochium nivale]|nr:phosphotransferase [Microdochium nivale]
MDQFQAADALLKYVYSGVLGPTTGMGVDYAVMRTTESTFTFTVTLEPLDGASNPLDRYQIGIDRQSGKPSAPKKIEINDVDMRSAVLAATGDIVASSRRFTDGGFSISYKVAVIDKPDTFYIVQLRFHGNVASMDAIMKFVRAHNEPGVIPMPAVYSIPGEAEHQKTTGFGRQITEFVPGLIAEPVYHDMTHAAKLGLVRKMALAWQACWDLPLSSPRQIGELIATDDNSSISLTVGPDRHYSLGGPFTSVREWLKARLQHALASLKRASGIDDYKEEYMALIQAFVNDRLDQMPQTIEACPIVALHIDMGLHNLIVSADDHQKINAIIDWELCASAPFLAAHTCLEMLFRRGAPNGFGAEYPQADLLRNAFWDAIPKWKVHWESQCARDFMEWFRFSLFLKPAYCSANMPKAEKMEFWAENIRVVQGMLKKYGAEE